MRTLSAEMRRFDAAPMTFHGGPLDGECHWVGTQTLSLCFNHRRGSLHLYRQVPNPMRMVYGGTVDATEHDGEVWTL